MYINFGVLTNRYNPPQIRIPLITQLRTITRPTRQPSNHTIMFLKLLHLSPILNINSIDTAITIPNK